MKSMYYSLIKRYLLCALCVITVCSAQDDSVKLKPYKITGSIGGAFSFHNANFAALPGIPNCCSGFTNGFGFSPTLSLGFEIIPNNQLLSLPYTYGVSLGYAGIGGDLSTEEFTFNYITGNTLNKVISRHNLETSISVISIDPYVTIFPLDQTPLGVTVGLSSGLVISKTFEQSQEITEPSTLKWVESGSPVKGSASGAIPQAQSLFFAPFIGLRYDIPLSSHYVVVPNVRLLPQLNSFVKDLEWSALHIRPSIELQYRFAEPQPEKLPPPPPPPVEIPKKLELSFILKRSDGTIVNEGESVKVDYEIRKQRYVHDAAPIVFFKRNSSEIPPQIPLAASSSEETAQSSVLIGLVALLRNDVDAKVELIGYHASDESSKVAENRVDNVNAFLLENGVDNGQITKRTVKQEGTTRDIREELLDEERSVRILVNKNMNTIPVVYEQEQTFHAPIILYFEPRIIADAMPYKAFGRVDFEMKTMRELNEKNDTLRFNTKDILIGQPTRVRIDYAVADATDRRKAAGQQFKISPSVKTIVETKKFNTSNAKSEVVLGYFNFNDSEFASVNSEAVQLLKSALAAGKKIQLSPKTDNFGTPEYNLNLAKSRIKSALQLLSADESQCTIIYDDVQQNYDPSPVARILHRTVVAKIIE